MENFGFNRMHIWKTSDLTWCTYRKLRIFIDAPMENFGFTLMHIWKIYTSTLRIALRNIIIESHISQEDSCILQNFDLHGISLRAMVFICLVWRPKQIMVAKFQTLMLLIAIAESSPLFFEAVTSLYMNTNAEKFRGDHCVNMVKWQAHQFSSKIIPEWSKISNNVLFFIDIHAYSKLHDYLHLC
jgi:hypothetical protein